MENRNLFQEIDSFEESSQGFCNLITNLSFHPSEDGNMDGEEQARDSVIVRNDIPMEDDDSAQIQKEGRPVLTYLGRLSLLLQRLNYKSIISLTFNAYITIKFDLISAQSNFTAKMIM